MKKTIAIILALVICAGISACDSESDQRKDSKRKQKSAAVTNVETLIAALPELPMESYEEIVLAREKIDAAEEAYNGLSSEEKNKVENWQIFETERARLFENEYESAALFIQFMNLNSEYVISGNVTIWNSVGASDFFSYQEDVFTVAELGYDGMINTYGSDNAFYIFWAAGKAVDDEYYSKNFNNFPSTKISETEEKCKSYVLSIENVEDSHETIATFIDTMMEDYSVEYSTKMDSLQNWWVESSLYADHALDPSGNLNSYISTANEYQQNIQRYQKLAGY